MKVVQMDMKMTLYTINLLQHQVDVNAWMEQFLKRNVVIRIIRMIRANVLEQILIRFKVMKLMNLEIGITLMIIQQEKTLKYV